jgi:hypothetical protein
MPLLAILVTALTLCALSTAVHSDSNENPVAELGSVAGDDDACLPFTMPSKDVLFSSARKVFAHYFYPFPLSIDNKPAAQDYYNTQYLNPNGESNKWLVQGGYLRQRPLAVAVNSDPNWQVVNMEREVRMAIARGITGFTVDVMSLDQATNAASKLHHILQAAQAVDPRFKIVVMPDIDGLGADASAVVQVIAAVASSPAAYRLSDGRLVVTAFNASRNPPSWWASVFRQLNAEGIKVAFVPTFLGWGAQASAFDSISYGFAEWGIATPGGSSIIRNDPRVAHNTYDKIYMMPVDPQQFRPKEFLLWEAGNSGAFRNAWMSAIQGEADWVQLVTWSDFSESSQVEPYTDASLAADIGTGYYNLNGYYAAWFLTRQQPVITHDVLYYFYRRSPYGAPGTGRGKSLTLKKGKAEDDIELLAFLAAPGVLKITVAGHTFEQVAMAGITSFKVPSHSGQPTFALLRDGADVVVFQGRIQIHDGSDDPSPVHDMTYWSGSAARDGVCSLQAN